MDATGAVPVVVKLHDFKNDFPSRQVEKMA